MLILLISGGGFFHSSKWSLIWDEVLPTVSDSTEVQQFGWSLSFSVLSKPEW